MHLSKSKSIRIRSTEKIIENIGSLFKNISNYGYHKQQILLLHFIKNIGILL